MAQLRQVGANGFQNVLVDGDSTNKRCSVTSLLAAHVPLTIYRTRFLPRESEQLTSTTREVVLFLSFKAVDRCMRPNCKLYGELS